jgi:hypothetical protein
MTPTPSKSASGAAAHTATEPVKPQEVPGPFVLNLCSSTTPMALSNPEQPELKRFSFFVSRRFEEGRERFRLHMGYFATLAEAEEWLGAVRDIYPGAWAGEAPGKKLRERAVAAAAAQAQHAAGPPPPVVSSATNASAPKTAAVPANVPTISAAPPPTPKMPALNVPTVHAAIPTARPAVAGADVVASSTNAATPAARSPAVNSTVHAPTPASSPASTTSPASSAARTPAPVLKAAPPMAPKHAPVAPPVLAAAPPRVPASTAAAPAAKAHSAPVTPAVSHSLPGAIARAGQPARSAPVAQPARLAAPVSQKRIENPAKAVLPNSNVREVLKALEEPASESEVTGETRLMPAPVLPGPGDREDNPSFTDTQVLRLLETRRADGTELAGIEVESGAISLLKPDDTGTRRALKDAVAGNQPVAFAVQLQWSVQPVELSKVPPLAIFSAYTLYTVEGSRDGRKWYGLRLGFFTDAISAKQVAYYVRSEFASVAVVPVSPQEKSRASDSEKKADLAFPKKSRPEPVDEFKLIDPDETAPSVPSRPVAAAQSSGKPVLTKAAGPAKSTPPSARRGSRGNRVRAREVRTPQTLEETLEILGAGQLEMDNGNGESLNESGVRHLRVEVQKNTPFGRLLERLSERVRKP